MCIGHSEMKRDWPLMSSTCERDACYFFMQTPFMAGWSFLLVYCPYLSHALPIARFSFANANCRGLLLVNLGCRSKCSIFNWYSGLLICITVGYVFLHRIWRIKFGVTSLNAIMTFMTANTSSMFIFSFFFLLKVLFIKTTNTQYTIHKKICIYAEFLCNWDCFSDQCLWISWWWNGHSNVL